MILRSLAFVRDSFFRSALLVLSGYALSIPAHGQGLLGVVAESLSHHPLAGTTVKVSVQDTTLYCITNETGQFTINTDLAGRASVEFIAEGYQRLVVSDVLLDGYSTRTYNALLEKAPFSLESVTVVASKNQSTPFVHTITSDDALRIAGNYEDPVRIALSEPGIVLINDQANFFSARGQSPLFNSWYLEGLTIVNPNHTSNAGTLSDLPTQYGGGVNMFSSQTLGNTDIYMGVNPMDINTNTGAVIDMHLHETSKPEWRAKAGLLGFELGGGTKLGQHNFLDVNLRYSFTGILTGLGADFGGEKINYYDGVISFRNEGKNHKLKLFTWAGRSTNEFDRVESPEDRESYKDFFDIDYDNFISGIGGRYDLSISKSASFRSGVAYSETYADYIKSGVYDFSQIFQQITFDTEITSLFAEFSFEHTPHIQSDFGLNFTSKKYLRSDNNVIKPVNVSSIRPYLNTSIRIFSKWLIDAGMELRYNGDGSEWEPGYRIQLNWNYSETAKLYGGMRHGTSDPSYTFVNYLTYISLLSDTYEIGWTSNWNQHRFGLNLFYQQMNRLEVYTNASAPDELEFLADYPNGQLAPYTPQSNNGFSQHSGVEGSYQFTTTNGWVCNFNQSVYFSERGIKDVVRTTGRYNGKYATHLAISKETLKVVNGKNKFWNFAVRGMLNGGLYEPELNVGPYDPPDYKYPVSYDQKLPDYFRIDLGITRTIAKSKVRWRYALDIQNVFGLTNIAYHYYDPYLDQIVPQNQLGIIPVLSVQASW